MDLHPGPEERRNAGGRLAELEPIQRALQENQDWYQDIVEHSQDLLCVHDLEGRLLSVNPAPARLLGYSVEELLRIPMREIIAPEFRSEFEAYLKQVANDGEARGLLALLTRSGQRRIWEYHNTLRTEGVASPIVRGTAHDVTEQILVQKMLAASREELLKKAEEQERTLQELKLFRTLLDQSSDAISVVEPETLRLLDVNERTCIDLGYSREELLAMTVYDIAPGFDQRMRAQVLQQIADTGSAIFERVHRRKDGSSFPVEVALRQVHLDRTYGVTVTRDITARKEAEARLRESESRYRAVHDLAPAGICWVETETGRFLQVNPKYCEIAGRTEEDMLGRTFQSITHPDDLANNLEKLRQLREGEVRHYEMEKRYIRPDGSVRWAEAAVVAMWPEGATPVWHMAIVQDITERKRAHEALRRSEENYRHFVSQSSEGIFREDMDAPVPIDLPEDELGRHILYDSYMAECNDAIARMYGMTSGREFIGKRLTEMLPPDDPINIELTRQYIRSGFRLLDRESHEVDIHGNPKIFLNSMIGIVENGMLVRSWGIQRDVTERVKLEEDRRKAEEALRRSEERLRVALDGSPIKVFNQDRDLRYTWVYNPQEGWSEEDYLGKTDDEIFEPEAAAKMSAIKRAVLDTGEGARRQFSLEARGKTYYCDLTVEPLRDAAGEVVGVNCACLDITRQREINEELRLAKEKLAEEKLYLEQAIDTELGFGEIIGRSGALKEVMEKVSKVAPSNATVLLLGETGTGKELVARALHRSSKRQGNSFIKLNCAAIPSGLLESELFGHEKGAFTGAVVKKLGRLELADGGTLFLDEIGEVPLDLQPKLLRVLQDQEFERLGGTQTMKVNFRLLAASNRDLQQSVKHKEFRSDLYYRLNVFPIHLPPLRERREDIGLLVEHFVRKYTQHMNKSITSIPKKTMEALVRWEWPGNIRELENFVERSVILTPGSVLQAPLGELHAATEEVHGVTLRDKERERILRALRECRGQIGGPNGAAARLGLKRTTLQSKLSQLGIKLEEYR